MNSSLECLPCFIRQSWEAARRATGITAKREQFMREVLRLVSEMDLRTPPPVMAQMIHRRLKEICGSDDPYREVKERGNRLAVGMYPDLKRSVDDSPDPFITAVQLAIAGNIIDVGANPHLADKDILGAVEEFTAKSIDRTAVEILRQAAIKARDILFLADNAGEIVFDRLLIEQLSPEKTTLAVKAAPILNDATRADVEATGLFESINIIDNGNDVPGTVLADAPTVFRRRFNDADLVIAKGQGNYETLEDASRPISFLLQAKCPVIAAHIGCDVGEAVVYHWIPTAGKQVTQRM